MRLVRSIATLSGFTILSRILGFIRDVLIAATMGAGPVADAFFVAFMMPNFFRRLFAEGAFNAAFVPTFSRILARDGKADACDCAAQVLSVLATILIVLVIVVEISFPWLIYGIASGFKGTPERLEMTIEFTRITFPYILFISLAALYTGILNSFHRFAAGAAAPILLNFTMILALFFFADSLETPGHALVWAVAIAGIGQLIWVQLASKHIGVVLKLQWPKLTGPVRRLMRLMIPGALAAGVIQVNMLIGIHFLSYLPTGAIAYFFFADRVNQLPLSLVGVAVSTALLPALSQQLELHKPKEALITQNRTLEFSFMLILPAALALFILSEPMIGALFERGALVRSQVIETAHVLSAFVLGLPAYVMVKIFSTSFFARHNTKIPLQGALLAVMTNVIFNFILIIPMQYVGIALATAIASWVNAAWLAYQLQKHKFFTPDNRLRERFPKFIIGCIIMTGVLEIVGRFLYAPLHGTEFIRATALIALIFIGLFVYAMAIYFLKALDIAELKANLSFRPKSKSK